MNRASFPLFFLLCTCAQALAGGVNVIHVTTTQDNVLMDNLCSLREAINNANTNTFFSAEAGECPAGSATLTDEIVLPNGLYPLTIPGTGPGVGDMDILPTPGDALTLDLRIRTQDHAAVRQAVLGQRVFYVMPGAKLELAGITVEDGSPASNGGGIYNAGFLWLSNAIIRFNSATVGGGIYNAGFLELRDHSVLLENTATSFGGGIFTGTTLRASDTTFNGNTATHGGGMFQGGDSSQSQLLRVVMTINTATEDCGGAICSNGLLGVSDSWFAGNESANRGGAIYSEGNLPPEGSQVSIRNTRFDSNRTARGAAVHVQNAHIAGSHFEDNMATVLGGALVVSRTGQLERLRILNNISNGNGGGVVVDQTWDPIRLRRSEIHGNQATGDGGGIHVQGNSTLALYNSTITNNSANAGGGLFIALDSGVDASNITLVGNLGGRDLHKYGTLFLSNSIISTPGQDDCLMGLDNPAIVSLGHNLASDTSCLGLNAPSDRIDTDPGLDSFGFHNTNASRTWSLRADSPALDQGSASACALPGGVESLDQRGGKRPFGAACDIGAHEQGVTVFDVIFADGFED